VGWDAIPLLPNLLDEWFNNPTSPLCTVVRISGASLLPSTLGGVRAHIRPVQHRFIVIRTHDTMDANVGETQSVTILS
jgi:hypothetical protein